MVLILVHGIPNLHLTLDIMRPMPLLPPVTTATRPLTLKRSEVLREVIFIKDNVSVDIE